MGDRAEVGVDPLPARQSLGVTKVKRVPSNREQDEYNCGSARPDHERAAQDGTCQQTAPCGAGKKESGGKVSGLTFGAKSGPKVRYSESAARHSCSVLTAS